MLAVPLIIGSWIALGPGCVGIVVLVYRTAREDDALSVELPGYREYCRRVRFRQIPGEW